MKRTTNSVLPNFHDDRSYNYDVNNYLTKGKNGTSFNNNFLNYEEQDTTSSFNVSVVTFHISCNREVNYNVQIKHLSGVNYTVFNLIVDPVPDEVDIKKRQLN